MGLKQELSEFSHAKLTFEQPMKKYSVMGVGGNADYFAVVDSLYGLNLLVDKARQYKLPYKIIGNGSNIIVSDKGFRGLIINLSGINDVFFNRDEVKAMAGANLEKLLKFCLSHRLSGLEGLSGIPATVGGAVVMNAGAFGKNVSDYVTTVQTLAQGKIKTYDKNECKFGYRKSRFLNSKEIVVSATFKFNESRMEIISASCKNYLELRRGMHPSGKSCGSVFKNPKNLSAGMLIEKAGLKGVRKGGAVVSDIHANFILNDGKATATDVYLLIRFIKDKIKREFDVELFEEVEFVGEF